MDRPARPDDVLRMQRPGPRRTINDDLRSREPPASDRSGATHNFKTAQFQRVGGRLIQILRNIMTKSFASGQFALARMNDHTVGISDRQFEVHFGSKNLILEH